MVKRASSFRTSSPAALESATKFVLAGLARRWNYLNLEVKLLGEQLQTLVESLVPDMVKLRGVGVDTAGALLVAAAEPVNVNETAFVRI